MKKIKLMSIMMLTIGMLSMLMACGGDGDEINNSPSPLVSTDITNGMHLVKISTNGFPSYTLVYNILGQIVKIEDLVRGQCRYYYTYSDNLIVNRKFQDDLEMISPSYYLTNGKISQSIFSGLLYTRYTLVGEWNVSYNYSLDGNLIETKEQRVLKIEDEVVDEEECSECFYSWQDGNIVNKLSTQFEYSLPWDATTLTLSSIYTSEQNFTYTNILNTIPFIFAHEIFADPSEMMTRDYSGFLYSAYTTLKFDELLIWQGYMGNTCKNLPSKILSRVTKNDGSSPINATTDFDYVITNGLITKISKTITRDNMSTPKTIVYDLEWQ